jgi:hypothetical protein
VKIVRKLRLIRLRTDVPPELWTSRNYQGLRDLQTCHALRSAQARGMARNKSFQQTAARIFSTDFDIFDCNRYVAVIM